MFIRLVINSFRRLGSASSDFHAFMTLLNSRLAYGVSSSNIGFAFAQLLESSTSSGWSSLQINGNKWISSFDSPFNKFIERSVSLS